VNADGVLSQKLKVKKGRGRLELSKASEKNIIDCKNVAIRAAKFNSRV
jgi:hypothetical protein